MKHKRFLSTLLSLAILLSCIGWTPSRAEETTPDVQAEQSQAAEQTESAVYTEKMSREELPEIVAQEAPLNHGHVSRLENEEQDNLNQFIFLNQDGTKTMYLYDHPVKYRDEAGNIHDISLNIADTDDTAYPFRTEANWAVTAFPRELANGITLESESAQIKMIPVLPENSTTALNHMARRVDEKTVAYTYDRKTAIEYALTYAGFKEEIVVSEYTGQTEYHFFLYTNGLALTQLDDGYFLTDEAGNIRGTIGDIIVFTADQRNNTFGQLQSVTVKENQIYVLTIVLDADYLADPDTKYPIRIDPTVELTYAESGADAIEDVLLQSNSASIGERTVAILGVSQKGISRLLMRFPGIDFSALEGVTVTSASVRLRDLMCEEFAMTVTCYPFTGDAWTESTADWSVTQQSWGAALSSHVFSYDNGEAQPTAFWYTFDITSLAQQWVNGTADEDKGILFKADASIEEGDTYRYKTIGTYETDGYKPTFTMTYRSKISLNKSVADVDEGSTLTLTATTVPVGQPVTWSSSNTPVATVSEDGLVSGRLAGKTTITATCADEDGEVISATCTVYVTLRDGVYYMGNANTDDHLTDEMPNVNEAAIFISDKNTSTFTNAKQFWRIAYTNTGFYTVQSVSRTNGYLTVDADGNVIVQNFTSGATIQIKDRWSISHNSFGYAFKHRALNDSTLMVDTTDAENPCVTLSAWESSLRSHWKLEYAKGVYFRDVKSQMLVDQGSVKVLDDGTSYTLLDLEMEPEYMGGVTYLSWSSSATSAAQVNTSGTVTAVGSGRATITLTAKIDGQYYKQSFTVFIGYPEFFLELVDMGCASYSHFKNTDDGFFMCTQPLAQILLSRDVLELSNNGDISQMLNVARYYDDWYLMCVQGIDACKYGLYRMREQESDRDIDGDNIADGDHDEPGTTVSFVALEIDALRNCLTSPSAENKEILSKKLYATISDLTVDFDDTIADYFSKTSADGTYLIAHEYVHLIGNKVENGCLPVPTPCVSLYAEIEEISEMISAVNDPDTILALYKSIESKQRIIDALLAINAAAGYTIYDEATYTIYINDAANLTYYEELVILLSHCGNASYNSFAAEIEFHADALFNWKAWFKGWPIAGDWYASALRSEMGVGEEDESGIYDEYYDLESDLVRAQAETHGEQ